MMMDWSAAELLSAATTVRSAPAPCQIDLLGFDLPSVGCVSYNQQHCAGSSTSSSYFSITSPCLCDGNPVTPASEAAENVIVNIPHAGLVGVLRRAATMFMRRFLPPGCLMTQYSQIRTLQTPFPLIRTCHSLDLRAINPTLLLTTRHQI